MKELRNIVYYQISYKKKEGLVIGSGGDVSQGLALGIWASRLPFTEVTKSKEGA